MAVFFKPYKKTKAEMQSIPIKEGQVIFTIDTKELYIDKSNTERILALSDTTYKVATSITDGLMAAADKKKSLENIIRWRRKLLWESIRA